MDVIGLAKSLADRSRLLILSSLLEKHQYLEELAQRLALAPSTVSFHLKKLERAGLVEKKKEQYYTIFYPRRHLLDLTLAELVSCEHGEAENQAERIQQYKKKVIASFFSQGRIIRIPAQKQKRWIVLEKILDEFEYGRKYTEKEVNEIIARFHDDYCTIRRTFVEEKVMGRSAGIYWITLDYERFRQGQSVQSIRHGLRESYEQSVRDKFGIK